MHPAMVLSAGLGTRLRPLTSSVAKPLVPVGDRPALAHVVEPLRAAGFAPIVVNAHHGAEGIVAFAERHGVRVSVERELLGTAGGVAFARELLGPGDVLVWNGDILASIDLDALRARHAASRAEATLAVAFRPANEGNVGLDGEGRVVRLRRESVAPGAERAGGDFLGVHLLGESLRARLPERGCLVGDVYLPALHAGARLGACDVRAPFVDVGTLSAYLEANVRWLEARGDDAFVGAGARVGPAVTLARSVIGAGAIVEGEGLVERSVVWPGARLVAPARGSIATPFGVFSTS